jgi:glycosyltransferase involved in cell wall biosynthesis
MVHPFPLRLFTMHPPLSLGILIRFANSESTLPKVLAALQRQCHQPQRILGVASHSTDRSKALLQEAGADCIDWEERYEHSRVLNFGLRHIDTDLVLVLSSHTVLESADTLAQMVAAMEDPRTACVSLKWDEDPFYSDTIDWNELRRKGLKFGSIYSNSMGMIRRSLWHDHAFDETLPTAEDYGWAIDQLKNGHLCRRLSLPFGYQRSGTSREGDFADVVFHFAKRHDLPVAWIGVRAGIQELLSSRRTQATKDRLLAYFRSRIGMGI